MKSQFLDASYFIAMASRRDRYHAAVVAINSRLGKTRLFTTEEVLIEFLNYFSAAGIPFRKAVIAAVKKIMIDPDITVLHQSHEIFLRGFELYEQRQDKQYSLTDCISMHQMRAHGIADALTTDRHFSQEGFNVLIRP